MPRLQKKCLMASFGMHGLLLFVLLLGSAFIRPTHQTSSDAVATHGDSPVIQMVTLPPQAALVDSITSQQAVVNQQPSPAQPAREKLPVKPKEGLDIATPAARIPRISTNVVTRPQQTANASTHQPVGHIDSEGVAQSLNNLLKALPSGRSIDLDLDFGSASGTGDSFYAQIVKATYTRTWRSVGTPSTSPGTTVVKVTIAKNGTVLFAVITSASGDEALDRSVQRTLERVRTIEPFEADAREQERVYTINFNLQSGHVFE
jgi:TonB family protein